MFRYIKLTINVNINAYCVRVTRKKTNLLRICQKSELNNQEIGDFSGILMILRTVSKRTDSKRTACFFLFCVFFSITKKT